MAAEREKMYECEVRRRRVKVGGGYEPFWKVKNVTQGVWVKTTKDGEGLAFGTGYVLRSSHEPFLIGKVGKPKVHCRSIRS